MMLSRFSLFFLLILSACDTDDPSHLKIPDDNPSCAELVAALASFDFINLPPQSQLEILKFLDEKSLINFSLVHQNSRPQAFQQLSQKARMAMPEERYLMLEKEFTNRPPADLETYLVTRYLRYLKNRNTPNQEFVATSEITGFNENYFDYALQMPEGKILIGHGNHGSVNAYREATGELLGENQPLSSSSYLVPFGEQKFVVKDANAQTLNIFDWQEQSVVKSIAVPGMDFPHAAPLITSNGRILWSKVGFDGDRMTYFVFQWDQEANQINKYTLNLFDQFPFQPNQSHVFFGLHELTDQRFMIVMDKGLVIFDHGQKNIVKSHAFSSPKSKVSMMTDRKSGRTFVSSLDANRLVTVEELGEETSLTSKWTLTHNPNAEVDQLVHHAFLSHDHLITWDRLTMKLWDLNDGRLVQQTAIDPQANYFKVSVLAPDKWLTAQRKNGSEEKMIYKVYDLW